MELDLGENFEKLRLVLRRENPIPELRLPQEAGQPGKQMIEEPRQVGIPDD